MSVPAILLCIAAVLFLVGQIRLGCSVEYSDQGLMVWIHIGALRISVYPIQKKEAKVKKSKPQKKKKEAAVNKEDGLSVAEKIGGAFDYIEQLFPIVLQALSHFRRKLRVNMLRLELTFGASDPADAAKLYGQASAALGALWYPLVDVLNVQDGYARTTPDFEGDKLSVYIYGKLSLKIGQLLWFGLYFGIRGLMAFLTVRKQHKTQRMQGKAV